MAINSTSESENQKSTFRSRFLRPQTFLLVALLLAMGVFARRGWDALNTELAASPRYRVSEQVVKLTPADPPPWIRTDVKSQVFRDSGITDTLSLLDEPAEIQQRLINAFELHPWVRKVRCVDLQGPGQIEITLEYREPVAVAEITVAGDTELIPVDRDAVRLPDGDLTEIEKSYLPRITGVPDRPLLGASWSDIRMKGAVELATNLRDVWEAYSLLDIVPSEYPEVQRSHRFYVYELRANGGTRIRWGAAPSIAPPNESAFADKLARLRGYIEQHGRLDSIDSPQWIDVRDALHIEKRIATKPEEVDEKKR